MDFLTWEVLGSMAGATVAITIILSVVQYLFGSGLDERIRNGIVTLVAIALIVATSISAGKVAWEEITLAVINGLIVALAVLRLYDTTISRAVLRVKGEAK